MVPRWPSWMEHHQRVMQACGGTPFDFGRRSAVECSPAED